MCTTIIQFLQFSVCLTVTLAAADAAVYPVIDGEESDTSRRLTKIECRDQMLIQQNEQSPLVDKPQAVAVYITNEQYFIAINRLKYIVYCQSYMT